MNPNKQIRIRAACQELEQALQNFEDDSELKEKAAKEATQITEIKKRLDEIKEQLDQLST